jgi:hypothetical protein
VHRPETGGPHGVQDAAAAIDRAVVDVIDDDGLAADDRGGARGLPGGAGGGEEGGEIVAEAALCFHPQGRRLQVMALQVGRVGAPGGDRGDQDGVHDRGPVGDGEEFPVQEGIGLGPAPPAQGAQEQPAGFPDLHIDEQLLLARLHPG